MTLAKLKTLTHLMISIPPALGGDGHVAESAAAGVPDDGLEFTGDVENLPRTRRKRRRRRLRPGSEG